VHTRAELAREVEVKRAAQKMLERQLAYFAVPGGLAQLALHRWLENNYDRTLANRIELAVFLVYLVIFVAMFVRMQRAERRNTPACPACGNRFNKMSASLAITTGRCDRCGAQVAE
jgi:hypothetical protein